MSTAASANKMVKRDKYGFVVRGDGIVSTNPNASAEGPIKIPDQEALDIKELERVLCQIDSGKGS